MQRTTPPNNWTAVRAARRAGLVSVDELVAEPSDTVAAPPESFNELRARAKAAGVSAGGSREDITARLDALEAG